MTMFYSFFTFFNFASVQTIIVITNDDLPLNDNVGPVRPWSMDNCSTGKKQRHTREHTDNND